MTNRMLASLILVAVTCGGGNSATNVNAQPRNASLLVRVVDDLDQPIADVSTTVTHPGGSISGRTNAGGTVRFDSLQAGAAKVRVDLPAAYVADETIADIVLLASKLFTSSFSLTQRSGALSVAVLDSLNGFVPSATVEARHASGAKTTVTTGTNGVAFFPRLAIGQYQIALSGAVLGSFSATAPVSIAEGQTLTAKFTTPPLQNGSWQNAPALREARASLAAVSNEDAIFVIGGASNSTTTDIDRFDGTSWTKETSAPEILNAPAAALVNNEIFVIGGFTGFGNVPTNRVQIYNLATKTWRQGAPMPTARGGIQATVLNGRIHVIGGGNDQSVLGQHEAYDPATDKWTSLAPLPQARGNPALATFGGRIYAIGGGAGGNPFSDVDIYDAATNQWSSGPAIPNARVAARAVVYRNALYVMGGEQNSGKALSDVRKLNAARDGWDAVTPMPTGRSYAGGVLFKDAIYILGGSTQAPTFHNTTGVGTAEKFSVRN